MVAMTDSASRTYFHASVTEGLTEVTPAASRGSATAIPLSDPEVASAFITEDTAWFHVQAVYGWAVHQADRGPWPVPRVYEVASMAQDIECTGTMDGYTSRTGFHVLREVPMPEYMGTPDDWRV